MAERTTTDAPTPAADVAQRMAAERTWLAWWRTALAATAGALATGSRAPSSFGLVALFTGGGVALALTTVVLIVGQT